MTDLAVPLAPGELPPRLGFLAGGGRSAGLILAHDWSAHPLGPPQDWPEALKITLSTMLNSPEVMFVAWGADTSALFFNDAYLPMLEGRAARALGTPLRDVWPETWARATDLIAEALAGRAPRFVDLPWHPKENDPAPAMFWTFSFSRILDADGAVAGLLVFNNETTKNVLTERAGAKAAEQLRRAQEAGGIGLFTVDADGMAEPTASFCRLYGLPPAPCYPAATFERLVVPEDDALMSSDASRADGSALLDVEYRIRRADTGEIRWIARRGEIERDDDGTFRRFTGVARDVTERVVARRQLAVERDQLRQMFAQATTFMALLEGPEHRVKRANPGYIALIGGRDVIGRTIREGLPETIEQGFVEILDRVYRTGEPFVGHTVRYMPATASATAAAVRYVDVVFQPIRGVDGAVTGIFVEGADVTDRAAAEDELRRLNSDLERSVDARTRELSSTEEQLRQSQKMEAVGQLTGGIAHDFNNMLTGVIGGIELVQRHLESGRMDRVGRYLDAASASAQRAAALTARLLAFGRRQSLDLQPTDVNQLVRGMLELLRRTLGEQVELTASLSPDAWTARTDHNQLESALLNLCLNGRDAMPDGGVLTIATANETVAGDGMEPGDYLVLTVTDTGRGMDGDVLERAFEPFFTTKPVGQGSGLGLSMIYGFARQSGGQVRIASRAGEGASVRLYLPSSIDVAGDQAASDGSAARGEGETVMIVEDDPSVRMIVLDVLEELGYSAIEARDASDALPILQSDRRIDLLVSDVGLPGMNGRDLAALARRTRPDLKVLFVTGYAGNASERARFRDDGTDVIAKPFAVEALATRIRRLLGKAAPPRP